MKREKMRFGFYSKEAKRLYLFGYTKEELVAGGITYENCSETDHLKYVVADVKQLISAETEDFSYIDPIDFPFNQPGERHIPLVDKQGWPLWIISVPFSPIYEKKDFLRSASFEPRAVLHEQFHMFQFKYFENISQEEVPPRNLRDCWSNADWVAELKREFIEMDNLLPILEAGNQNEIINHSRAIVARRNASKVSTCWNAAGYWERMEGTAQFFEVRSSQKVGLSRTWDSWNAPAKLSTPGIFDKMPEPDETEFFYITGARLCQIMEKLDRSGKWQKWIESGLTPFQALENLLKSQKSDK